MPYSSLADIVDVIVLKCVRELELKITHENVQKLNVNLPAHFTTGAYSSALFECSNRTT